MEEQRQRQEDEVRRTTHGPTEQPIPEEPVPTGTPTLQYMYIVH